MAKRIQVTEVCGWCSLGCWAPLGMLALGRWVQYPDGLYPYLLWGLFLSPFVGLGLALIAASRRLAWLALGVVWLVALGLGWWDLARHPFVI